jgi:hypothetical protein
MSSEDRLIGLSIVITFSGIMLAALLGNPGIIGTTAVVVILLLLIGWLRGRSDRLAWLLIDGLIAGILELWADWVHVTQLGSLVYTDY